MSISERNARLLIQAFTAAFDLRSLEGMLRQELGVALELITPSNNPQEVFPALMAEADSQGWLNSLVAAARAYHPHDPALQSAADQLGLAPRLVVALRPDQPRERRINDATLRQVITGANSLLDLSDWREKLGEIEYQVCRLEIAAKPAGTGFLVGPDLLMTCYHVVEDLIQGSELPEDFVARFDFKKTRSQEVVNPGREFHLSPDWIVDWSPYNPAEAAGDENALPGPEEMDYAVLRLAGSPGSQPVTEQAAGERPRGWISLNDQPYLFSPGSPLFIVQHPSGAPLKLALDTQAVLGLNGNATRVRYRTNTQPGSSGSPCFNSQWELVALHHSGIVRFNEGIPLDRIAGLLKQRGKWPLS